MSRVERWRRVLAGMDGSDVREMAERAVALAGRCEGVGVARVGGDVVVDTTTNLIEDPMTADIREIFPVDYCDAQQARATIKILDAVGDMSPGELEPPGRYTSMGTEVTSVLPPE